MSSTLRISRIRQKVPQSSHPLQLPIQIHVVCSRRMSSLEHTICMINQAASNMISSPQKQGVKGSGSGCNKTGQKNIRNNDRNNSESNRASYAHPKREQQPQPGRGGGGGMRSINGINGYGSRPHINGRSFGPPQKHPQNTAEEKRKSELIAKSLFETLQKMPNKPLAPGGLLGKHSYPQNPTVPPAGIFSAFGGGFSFGGAQKTAVNTEGTLTLAQRLAKPLTAEEKEAIKKIKKIDSMQYLPKPPVKSAQMLPQNAPNARRRPMLQAQEKKIAAPAVKVVVRLDPDGLTIAELAKQMAKKVDVVVECLKTLGAIDEKAEDIPSIMLDVDTAELACIELRIEAVRTVHSQWDVKRKGFAGREDYASFPIRSPVVSVMGHVDHGKTTLLDTLKKTNVAAGEEAGITQRLGAFSVKLPVAEGEEEKPPVTFFDTPGHAAFSAMRQSAGSLTDVIVIVIAAEEGVQQQTVEVLDLLKRQTSVEAVVALTKCDRDGIDKKEATERIGLQLLEHGIEVEAYGGNVPIVPISGLTGEGLPDLIEAILLQAEMMDLRADPEAAGEGVVIDGGIYKHQGIGTDVLISWGGLRVGDVCVVGEQYGKIQRMQLSDGTAVERAGVSTPVRVYGLHEVPKAGEEVIVVPNEERAAEVIEMRQNNVALKKSMIAAKAAEDKSKIAKEIHIVKKEAELAHRQLRRAIGRKAAYHQREANRPPPPPKDDHQVVTVVFKADGQGAIAAMHAVLMDLPESDEVSLHIAHTGVGPITTGDIDMAAVGDAIIYAFNVEEMDGEVTSLAREYNINIRTHKVIYRFAEEVKAELESRLAPKETANVHGTAEVLQIFNTDGGRRKVVVVAGTKVLDGELKSTSEYRVLRDGEVVYKGATASSMRHFKDRVTLLKKGMEGGISLDGFSDYKPGDILEAYTTVTTKRKLGEAR